MKQEMNVSMSLNIFDTTYPAEQSIARCRAAGFTALDLNYWDHQPRVRTMTWEDEQAWIYGVRSAAEDNGVRFTQMHGPVHGRSFAEMVLGLDTESFLAMAERSLRAAAILEIPWVVFHPGELSAAATESYEEVLEGNFRFYSRLFPVMEETGVGIALENTIDGRTPEQADRRARISSLPEHLVDLVDGLNHELIGACWDTGHGHASSLDQMKSVHLLGSRLKALHVQDNDGVNDQHLLPFQGTINWSQLMKALRDIQYTGDFTYEAHRSLHVLPDELFDAGLKYAKAVGDYLVGLAQGEPA